MPTISIPLDTCLLCNGRRVEEGDTVKINLDPDKFSPEIITGYSPVTGTVTEVRVPSVDEPASAAFTIEVEVSGDDLPPGVTTLEACCDIASVSCFDCCASLTERIEDLEAGTLSISYSASITGLTGGGATKLDGVATTSSSAGLCRLVFTTSQGFLLYRLTAGTDAENSPKVVRPDDFDVSTNAKVWKLAKLTQNILDDLGASISTGQLTIIKADGSTEASIFPPATGARAITLPSGDGTLVLGDGVGITSASLFRTALGLTAAAILDPNRVLETEPAVTGFTGGGATNLDGVATTTLNTGTKRRVFVSSKEYIYELVTGTDAENSPYVVRPDDYNSLTNAKVWKLRARFYVGSADIHDATAGGGGSPDAGKVVLFSTGGTLLSMGISVRSTLFTVNGTFNADGISLDRTYDLPDASGVMALVASATGVPAPTDISWSATNDSATAGDIGEFTQTLVAAGSAVALTTATAADIASISLTAGDWDVEGWINFAATGGTVTGRVGSISATSATHPIDGSQIHQGYQTTTTTETTSVSLPRKRISLAATTTIYLVATGTFSAGSMGGFGGLNARRVR